MEKPLSNEKLMELGFDQFQLLKKLMDTAVSRVEKECDWNLNGFIKEQLSVFSARNKPKKKKPKTPKRGK